MIKKLTVLISLLSVLFFSPVNQVFAGLGVMPVKTNVPDKSWFVYEGIEPGDLITDQVKITNTGDEPIAIKAYSVDGLSLNAGGFALKELNEPQIGVGKWIDFYEKINLAPKEVKIFDFEFTVPKNVVPGDYAGGIIGEIIPGATKSNIKIVARVGARIYLSVKGEVITDFKWDDYQHIQDGNKHYISFDFSNGGNTTLTTNIDLQLKNSFGEVVNTYSETMSGLLPGDSSNIKIHINPEDIPFVGVLEAVANVKYSRNSISGKVIDEGEIQTKSIKVIIPPPAWLLYSVTGFIILILSIIIIRKLLLKRLLKSTIPYVVRQGDTIQSVASAFRVDWKKITKANGLKSPYFINPDQEILVPVPPEVLAKLQQSAPQ